MITVEIIKRMQADLIGKKLKPWAVRDYTKDERMKALALKKYKWTIDPENYRPPWDSQLVHPRKWLSRFQG